ncbi:MAG: hypothetical protein J3Q66DRAFT_406597 [Benniella sp.]|nr:MAG: hypothetical protein J3Q66DRAFT_406597 [Benniella sp.]
MSSPTFCAEPKDSKWQDSLDQGSRHIRHLSDAEPCILKRTVEKRKGGEAVEDDLDFEKAQYIHAASSSNDIQAGLGHLTGETTCESGMWSLPDYTHQAEGPSTIPELFAFLEAFEAAVIQPSSQPYHGIFEAIIGSDAQKPPNLHYHDPAVDDVDIKIHFNLSMKHHILVLDVVLVSGACCTDHGHGAVSFYNVLHDQSK